MQLGNMPRSVRNSSSRLGLMARRQPCVATTRDGTAAATLTGLSGEEIAIESRIIALADAYDGMTSGRRSGTGMSRAAALQEVDHGLGTRFDPLLAEEFIRLVGTTSSLGWSDEWAVRG